MLMPAEVIVQVHCLTRRAEAKNALTFTNINNEDLDVLYAARNQDEDDVDPGHDNDELAGVDGEDDEDAHGDNYDPEQDDDEDLDDEDDDGSNDVPDNNIPAI
jgi:hypothetical protein